MNKKKITGLIIFAIFIGLVLGYPSLKEGIEESLLKRKVESALAVEDYEKVQELLKGRRLDRYAWDYVPYFESKARLGNSMKLEIQSLIRDNQISILQYLVDNLGEFTYQYVELLIPVRGLVLDGDSRYEVANERIKGIRAGDPAYAVMIDEAMHIRGEKATPDNIEVRFYSYYDQLEKAVELYKNLDVKYKQDAKEGIVDSLILHVLHGSSSGVVINPVEEAEMLNWFEGINLSEDLFHAFSKEVALRYLDYEGYVEPLVLLANGPFFDYYRTLGQLNRHDVNSNMIQNVLRDLKSREEYKDIEGYSDIVRVLENYELVKDLKGVGSNGTLLYLDVNNKNIAYNSTNHRKELEVPGSLNILAYSTGREYYLASGYNINEGGYPSFLFTDVLLDRDFNILAKSGLTSSFSPDDEKWIREVSTYTSQTEFYQTPLQMGIPRNYEAIVSYRDILDLNQPNNFLIYSVTQDAVSVLEYTQNSLGYNRKATYYKEYDIDTNEILYQFDLKDEGQFIGSCEKSIYLANAIDDVLFVIQSIDKKTLERKTMPFYIMAKGGQALIF